MKETTGPHCPWIIAPICAGWEEGDWPRINSSEMFTRHRRRKAEGHWESLSRGTVCLHSWTPSTLCLPLTHKEEQEHIYPLPPTPQASCLLTLGPILIPDRVYDSDHWEEREANSNLPRIASLNQIFSKKVVCSDQFAPCRLPLWWARAQAANYVSVGLHLWSSADTNATVLMKHCIWML